MTKKTSICALALLAFFVVAAPSAYAQEACSPAAPNDGDSVVCSGTGTGILDGDLDDATITVDSTGVITGVDQGFEFDDDVTFENFGIVTGLGDHGVQGDNDVTVTNYGTIIGQGGGDGVNIDNDGVLINYGTIIGSDDGVQLEDTAEVVNHASGIIRADDEGVNINTDGAILTNHGLIEAVDDAVNAATNAVIVNTGTIRSTGDQDGIDLDSGTITNSGLIISEGSEDGIDFDPSTDASIVTNTGRIEGAIGINTDPADTGAQTIINSGEIIGRSGVAMNLGGGDDVLEIAGGSILGVVDLGIGSDTLIVSGATTGIVTFMTDPEALDIQLASALYADGALVSVDPARFGLSDQLSRSLAYHTASAVNSVAGVDGIWASGTLAGAEGEAQGQFALGADFGTFGVFLTYAGGKASGIAELGQADVAAGLRKNISLGQGTDLMATVLIGHSTLTLEDIEAETGGLFAGLSARLRHESADGLVMSGGAGVTQYHYDAYTAAGLGGTEFSARTITTGFVEADLGKIIEFDGLEIMPYVGLTALFSEGDAVEMTRGTESTSFGGLGDEATGLLRIGTTLSTGEASPWQWQAEAQLSSHGDAGVRLSGAIRF